ncbi:hypothetical protein WDZ17_12945, partial [Pseudokineococcus basanitobsidens]
RAGARALDVPAGGGLDAGVLTTAHALARLAQGPRPPRTPVRLDGAATAAVAAEGSAAVTEAVRRAAGLGAFRPELADGPWEGAALGAAAEVRDARDRAGRLADDLLPRLAGALDDLGGQTGLRRPRTAVEVERRLGLLEDVRGTLEDFLPGAYERPLGELARSLGQDAAWRTRRTAQKVVAEVVRPGQRPADLRTALRRADAERRAWAAEAEDGGRPRVPAGISAARRALAAVTAELDRLEPVLRPTREGGRLREVDLADLRRRLHLLAEDPDAGGDLPARVDVLVHLRALGLGDLLADLRERGVDAAAATAELELCVRASALEEARRRGLLDELLPGRADALRAEHDAAVARERAAAAAEVVAGARSAAGGRPLVRLASLLALPQRVAPLGRPGTGGAADDDGGADLVVLLDASTAAVPQAALALARGAQVLLVGDPCGVPPAEGVVGAPAPEHPGAAAPLDAWTATTGVLDEHVLRRRHRLPRQLEPVVRAVRAEVADPVDGAEGDRAEAAADAPGDGPPTRAPATLRAAPAPPGSRPVVLRHVTGRGRPAPEGVVHSLDVEVAETVAVVLDRLRRDPESSLGVVALTRGHARRVADALREAVAADPALAAAMARASRGGEPLVVTDVARAAGCVRDVLVLTTAFAPTERGRVLSSFGPLDAAGGAAALAVATAGARRRLVVVTCLSSPALPEDRLRTPGARALRALLASVEAAVRDDDAAAAEDVDGGAAHPEDGPVDAETVDAAPPGVADLDLLPPGDDAARALSAHASAVPAADAPAGGVDAGADPLVGALVERLRAGGALVRRAECPGDPDLTVVRPDGAAAAVLPDVRPAGAESGPSAADPVLRAREAARLRDRGWAVVHVSSTGLLVDPAGETARVLAAARPAEGAW